MDIFKSIKPSDLPSPPGVAMKLLEIFDDPELTIETLAEVISVDPGLTARIIDYCNSPLLGRAQKTTNLQQAVVTLGLRAVKMIALSFSLVQTSGDPEDDRFDYEAFWNQSLATAIAAKTIAHKKSNGGDEAFLLGLMLNIGQVAIALSCPREFAAIKAEAFENNAMQPNVALACLERQTWETDHYEVGCRLLNQWNFPSKICDSVGNYGNALAEPDALTSWVSFGEQLAIILFNEQNISVDAIKRFQKQLSQELGIDESEVDCLISEICSRWAEYAKLLKMDCIEVESIKDLEDRAKASMTMMMLGMQQENQAIQHENEQLKSKVLIDELTQLKNRRAYETEVPAELERARRNETPVSLMVADIDFFKKINDTYGHDAGDAVLTGVAECLKTRIRPYDEAFRFGGEEFVLLLANCGEDVALTIGERIRTTIESHNFEYEGTRIKVTVSIGIAISMPSNPGTVASLFKHADSLLYEAKRDGRNCCRAGQLSEIPVPHAAMPMPDNTGIPEPLN